MKHDDPTLQQSAKAFAHNGGKLPRNSCSCTRRNSSCKLCQTSCRPSSDACAANTKPRTASGAQRNGSHTFDAYVEGKLDTYPSNACKQPEDTSRKRAHLPKRYTKAANRLVGQICDQKVGHGDRVQDRTVAVVTLQRTPQEAKPRALQRTAAERNGARTPEAHKARACSTRPVAGPMAAQRVREQKPWFSQAPGAERMQ